jgi:hypothetical protein
MRGSSNVTCIIRLIYDKSKQLILISKVRLVVQLLEPALPMFDYRKSLGYR